MSHQNSLICNMETGVCGIEENDENNTFIDLNPPKKIDVYYVTDPICSHCWALEPVLRRFIAQYGHYFNFHTVMGGLLEKWSDTPVDPGNGISRPSDVAEHWREVGTHSRMPIDGTLWYDNPVQSSFPPSRVFKVIQNRHSDAQAMAYLRRTREALFAFNHNIAERSVMVHIVNQLGLDGESIIQEAEQEVGRQLLDEDFQMAARLGVRGFPTIVMVNQQNQGVKIVGARSIEQYVDALTKILDTESLQPLKPPTLVELLQHEKLLFSKEIEAMYDLTQDEVQAFIEQELTTIEYQTDELLGETYVQISETR